MSAFTALVRKDLLQFLSNRRAMVMTILAPVLIAAFFGSLFGSQVKASRVPVALSDLDDSETTRRIRAQMLADDALDLRLMPEAAARAEVQAGRLRAAIVIPAGFSEAATRAVFGGGAKPELVITHDPSQGSVLPLVRGLVAQHVTQPLLQAAMGGSPATLQRMRDDTARATGIDETRRRELTALFDSIERVQAGGPGAAGAVAAGGSGGAGNARVAAAASSAASGATSNAASSAGTGPGAGAAGASGTRGGLGSPFTLREVEAAGAAGSRQEAAKGYNSYAHSFAGMGVQFILMQGVEAGVALLLMRRSALWLRLRASPINRAQLLGSRMASGAIIAAGVFALLYVVAMAVFGVRVLGSAWGLVAIIAAFALMTAAFGLMIAAIGRSPEATRGLAILATLLLVMVGGAWVPSFLFPAWLQRIAEWTPTHWAVQGLDAMTWRAQPIGEALMPVAVQLGFALLFAAIALWRLRWDE